jgi:hypothetical protein
MAFTFFFTLPFYFLFLKEKETMDSTKVFLLEKKAIEFSKITSKKRDIVFLKVPKKIFFGNESRFFDVLFCKITQKIFLTKFSLRNETNYEYRS